MRWPPILDEFYKEGNFTFIDEKREVVSYLKEFYTYEALHKNPRHPAFVQTYMSKHGIEFKLEEFLHYTIYPWGNDNVVFKYDHTHNIFQKIVLNIITPIENYELEDMAHRAAVEYMSTTKDSMPNPISFMEGYKAAHKHELLKGKENA